MRVGEPVDARVSEDADTVRGVLIRETPKVTYVSVRSPLTGRVGTLKCPPALVTPAQSAPATW